MLDKSTARVSLAEVLHPWVRWEGPGSGFESLSASAGGKSGIFKTNYFAEILKVFFYLLDPKLLDFQVPRSPNFWISRSPDLQIPRFPGSQISKLPDFQTPAAPAPDELSDPNLTPLPTHPGIKYVARALAAILGEPPQNDMK